MKRTHALALVASFATVSLLGVARAGPGDGGDRTGRGVLVRAGSGCQTLVLGHGRGFLGAQLTDMTPELRAYFGAPEDAGALVTKVVPGSPAQTADLRVGDVITAIEGESIDSPWDLIAAIRPRDAGESVALEVWRDGRPLELTATLDERAHQARDLGKSLRWMRGRSGGPPLLAVEGVEIDVDVGRRIAESLRSIDWDEVARRLPHRELQDRMEVMERRLRDLEKKLEAAEGR